MAIFLPGDPDNEDRMRAMFHPGQVDHQIRQAIDFAWMMLPQEKQTTAEVEQVVRQVVERALKDFPARAPNVFWEDGETLGRGD
jgi:hypothetical protein